MLFLAAMDLAELAERFSGWGVVVWIVWWLTKRWEVQMTAQSNQLSKQTEAITKLAEAFSSHKVAETLGRREQAVKLDRILGAVGKTGS